MCTYEGYLIHLFINEVKFIWQGRVIYYLIPIQKGGMTHPFIWDYSRPLQLIFESPQKRNEELMIHRIFYFGHYEYHTTGPLRFTTFNPRKVIFL